MDRKSRNRRGGHETSMPSNHRFGNECTTCTPVEKKIIKRLSKKKMRRQWASTQKQVAIELANDWTWEDRVRELDLETVGDYLDWEHDNYDSFLEQDDDECYCSLCTGYDYDYAHGYDDEYYPYYDDDRVL